MCHFTYLWVDEQEDCFCFAAIVFKVCVCACASVCSSPFPLPVPSFSFGIGFMAEARAQARAFQGAKFPNFKRGSVPELWGKVAGLTFRNCLTFAT